MYLNVGHVDVLYALDEGCEFIYDFHKRTGNNMRKHLLYSYHKHMGFGYANV